MKIIRITILTILTLFSFTVKSQQYEVGLSAVGTGYMGDLNNYNPAYINNLGGGLFLKYNLNPTWGFKLGVNYLPTSGNDLDFKNAFQQDRGLSFKNNLAEISLVTEFNFFRFIAGRQLNRYTPYLIGGVAAIQHNPYVVYNNSKIKVKDLLLEEDDQGVPISYSNIAISIPLGVGFKYNIKGPWTLGAEVIYRTALSDNIDNVSGNYPISISARNGFTENELRNLSDPSLNFDFKAGTARGDGKKFDGYMSAGFTLTYTFISRRCYWWQ